MKGIDVSNNNGHIDFNKVKNAGIEVIIIKATEGVDWVDPLLEEHYSKVCGKGFSIGFYHFMSEKTSPSKQAEDFYNAIKDKEYNVLPCLDIETNNVGRNATQITDRCLEFLIKFKELSGLDCMIYTGGYFGRDNLDSRIKNYPCWAAHYGVSKPMDMGFKNVVGHQYTENGRIQGINGVCDLNVFNNGVLLGKSTSTQPQTSVKATGKVAELQGLCNSILGTSLVIDNIYGSCTDSVVRKLPLCGLPYVQRELTKWIQLRLGCVVDGIFGQKTKEAVIAWQYSHGLVIDGIVGYNTYRSLALA